LIFKSDGLINQLEKVSRQSNTQAVAWLLLSTFIQVYSKNREKRAEQKDLGKLAVWSETPE
jgi:hypothetical protein